MNKIPDIEVPPKGKRQKPVVYLVDDDETILRSLRIALASRYMVRTCSKPTRSVVEIKTFQPDVILLDIRMPEHDGFWVLSEIRKFNADVPIIFNSAYQDAMDKKDVGSVYRPFAYLPKSGRLDDLLDTFERAILAIQWQPAA
jgi:DNA-binding response OmpR family regulator